ncbi:MAG: hypothetical protein ABJZ55_02455 [Fuerstiella sp.]
MKISDFVTNTAIALTAVTAGLLVAWGFSGTNTTTVQGVVKLDGQTVPWADVVFVSADPDTPPMAVKANAEGQYQLHAVLPSGPYRIVARGTAVDESLAADPRADELDEYQRQMMMSAQRKRSKSAKAIPESYGAVATSPLQTDIVDGQTVEFNLQLSSSPRQLANGQKNQPTTMR